MNLLSFRQHSLLEKEEKEGPFVFAYKVKSSQRNVESFERMVKRATKSLDLEYEGPYSTRPDAGVPLEKKRELNPTRYPFIGFIVPLPDGSEYGLEIPSREKDLRQYLLDNDLQWPTFVVYRRSGSDSKFRRIETIEAREDHIVALIGKDL